MSIFWSVSEKFFTRKNPSPKSGVAARRRIQKATKVPKEVRRKYLGYNLMNSHALPINGGIPRFINCSVTVNPRIIKAINIIGIKKPVKWKPHVMFEG